MGWFVAPLVDVGASCWATDAVSVASSPAGPLEVGGAMFSVCTGVMSIESSESVAVSRGADEGRIGTGLARCGLKAGPSGWKDEVLRVSPVEAIDAEW